MPSPTGATRRRPLLREVRSRRSRRPQRHRSWVARNLIAIAGVALVVVVVAVLLVARGDDVPVDAGGLAGGDFTGGDFHSFVVDPANPRRLFMGGHAAVAVSTDRGASWAEVESLRDADAMGWAFTSDAVYASGPPGLNRSTDGGRSFRRVNEGLPDSDVPALGGTDEVLYGASPTVGLFVSTARSGSWDLRTSSAGQSFFGRIVVDPTDTEHLFATAAGAGVVESTDGGKTWRRVDSGLDAAVWLTRGGEGMAVLVASGPAGAARSTDGGRTWARIDLPAGATLVEAVPGDADLFYAGVHRGKKVEVRVSRDGGTTWTST